MCAAGATHGNQRGQEGCCRGPEDTVPRGPSVGLGVLLPWSLLSFLHYKAQTNSMPTEGEPNSSPRTDFGGPAWQGPRSVPYTHCFPALIISSADEALSQSFPYIKTPALIQGPAPMPQHPASPPHRPRWGPGVRAHTSLALLGMRTSAPYSLSSCLPHTPLGWSHTNPPFTNSLGYTMSSFSRAETIFYPSVSPTQGRAESLPAEKGQSQAPLKWLQKSPLMGDGRGEGLYVTVFKKVGQHRCPQKHYFQ